MMENNPNGDHNLEQVLFIGNVKPTAGSVQLHSGAITELSRSLEAVKEDWNVITHQISAVISSTHDRLEAHTGFQMDEVETSLAFSAKGKLAFIAEAGAEASIKIIFKRKHKDELSASVGIKHPTPAISDPLQALQTGSAS